MSDGPWVPVLGQRQVVAAAVVDDGGDGQELAGEIEVVAGQPFTGTTIVSALVLGKATFTENTRRLGVALG